MFLMRAAEEALDLWPFGKKIWKDNLNINLPWTPKPWKIQVFNHQYMGPITPKNDCNVGSHGSSNKNSLFTNWKEIPNFYPQSCQVKVTWLEGKSLRYTKILKSISVTLQGDPPMPPLPRNKALIRPYQGKPMVNSPLIRPYFLGGVALGGSL